MTSNHNCIHEDQFIGQSRAIERISNELNYKKEKLDELKKDNERMDKKLDEIKNCVNEIILASKRDDSILKDIINEQNNRITALETAQNVIKWVLVFTVSLAGTAIAILAFILTHVH